MFSPQAPLPTSSFVFTFQRRLTTPFPPLMPRSLLFPRGRSEYDVPYHMRVSIDNQIAVGKWYNVRTNQGSIVIKGALAV